MISVINSPGSISLRSICSNFASQSAVISGRLDFFGHHGDEGFAFVGGQQHLGFLGAFRSRKPFCTSFSMVAARVAGVPMP